MPLAFWKAEWDIQLISVFLPSPPSPLCTIWSSFIRVIHRSWLEAHTHRESTPQQKADSEFPSANDFLGTIPIKGWNSLWSGFPSTLSSTTTVGYWLEQQPWLCFPAAAPLHTPCSNTLKILLPWVGEPLQGWQLIAARQFPQGIISAHLRAPASHHEVWKWKMSLSLGGGMELNVLSGLSQPKLFWDWVIPW